jgi:protein phosphatase PTC1
MEDTHAYLYNFLGTPAPTAPDINGNDPPGASSESQASDVSSNVVETDNGYFSIFDGHAGTFAAEWCGKKLHLILEDIMRKNPNTPVPELLDQTFTSVDQQLEKLPLKNSGCTAVIAVLRWEDRVPSTQSATGSAAIASAAAAGRNDANAHSNDTPTQESPSVSIPKLQRKAQRQRVLYTANVGDARIVLCRNGKALRLSYDHKGSDENEGKRIANAGGLILNNRVNGVLAVTRALGDAYLKDLVTGHPYTTETVIQPDADEFIILACDGVNIRLFFPELLITADCFSSYGMFAVTKKLSISFAMSRMPNMHPRFWLTTLLHDSVPITFPAWSSDSIRPV